MKQTKLIGLMVAVACLAVPLAAAAEEALIVPPALDFEQVLLGESVTLPLEIRSVDAASPLIVTNVYIPAGDDAEGAFEIPDPPVFPVVLLPTESIFVDVTFTPAALGEALGNLIVESNDHADPDIDVPLSGEGVEEGGDPTPADLIDELIEYFDDAVAADQLAGTGRNDRVRSARLAMVRWRLEMVRLFIEWDLTVPACQFLRWLDLRSDGDGHPHDFVEGAAAQDFNDAVNELREALECGSGGGCGR